MSAEYRVVVTRENRNWLADVPQLSGAHTFARDLETLDRYVREVVVLAADLADDDAPGLTLVWEYHTGDDAVDEQLRDLREARRSLDSARDQLEQRTQAVIRDQADRFTVPDFAALLGLSRARVQRLIQAARRV